ncbi:MAG: hypothetical protein QM731_26550 [Chitinophagaceae bacterium]
MKNLLQVSLRQYAIYIPADIVKTDKTPLTPVTSLLLANLAKLGYHVSEPLKDALNNTAPALQAKVFEIFREVMGVHKNWTPLVKEWNIPTGESLQDHIVTFFANIFKQKGTILPCGHAIPDNTFPLHRYNGCPFCGTPFEAGNIENFKQGSGIRILELWTDIELNGFLNDLLTSKTALDATQMDSLRLLLEVLPVPQVKIGMKETLMAVIDIYVKDDQYQKAQELFASPADILRYLWFKHTGFLQVVAPKTIIKRVISNNRHFVQGLDKSAIAKLSSISSMKLKYTRKECIMVATWLNNIPLSAERICESMHPKRSMWVRFIRALRLAEYSKRKNFAKLRTIMDLFYTERYDVWAGRVEHFRLRYNAVETFSLMQQRPGLFARSLFANMLWFGPEDAIAAFTEVIDKIPARLVLTLSMYSDNYFDKTGERSVKPLGGNSKKIAANYLLTMYDEDQLKMMKEAVTDLAVLAIKKRFSETLSAGNTMYIDPALFKIPVAIGDRTDTVQDIPAALMGTRFTIAGNTVRLFMQWGYGLPAQHMDMDLSCVIAYNNSTDFCSFSKLSTIGCRHSGDIRNIPDKTGTAEYIDVDIPALQKAGAVYVIFSCNAYSNGSTTPNLVVGWMNSRFPMKISEKTGVAYDPSCVQHQVRITGKLTKGLVFGVLDVKQEEIVWLEMPFGGQVAQQMDISNVSALLKKLDSKLNIGALLQLKASAQGITIIDTADADENYTLSWARNTAAVTKLLID